MNAIRELQEQRDAEKELKAAQQGNADKDVILELLDKVTKEKEEAIEASQVAS